MRHGAGSRRIPQWIAGVLAVLLVVDTPIRVLAQAAAAAGAPSHAALAGAARARAEGRFGDAAENWPAYSHPDGGVVVRSPDGDRAVVSAAGSDGSSIDLRIYERKGRLVEVTSRQNGVWLTLSLSGLSGPVAPAGPPLDLPPGALSPAEPASPTSTEPVIPLTERTTPPDPQNRQDVQRMVAVGADVQVPGATNPGALRGTLAAFGMPASPEIPSRATAALAGVQSNVVPLPAETIRAWSQGVMRDLRESSRFFSGETDTQGRLVVNGQVIADTTKDGLEAVRRYLESNATVLANEMVKMRDLPRAEKARLLENLIDQSAVVRRAFSEFKQAEALYQLNGPLAAESNRLRYENGLAEAKKLEESGQTELAKEMRDKADNEVYPRYVRARARYLGLLDSNPLLGVKVDDEFLYDALASVPQAANPSGSAAITAANQQGFIDLLNAAFVAGETQVREQATRFALMRDISALAELASPRYAAVHQRLAMTGPPIMADLMAELAQASEGSLKSWTDEAWDKILADPRFMVVPVLLAFVPLGIALGVVLTAYQLHQAADDYLVAVADEQNTLANAPIAGFDPVPDAQSAAVAAGKNLGFQLVTLPIMAYGTVQQVKTFRIQRAQGAEFKAIQEAYRSREAFRQALDDAIPAGRVAAVGTVSSPRTILRRIDTRWLAEHPRAGVPGDERFFVENGLEPQLTIKTGAYTFHVTAPFRADGHLAVIAFQEFADGKVVPRTFYLSGEHAVWRVATSRGVRIDKGFKRLVYINDELQEVDITDLKDAPTDRVVGHPYMNEHVADLAAELQGPINRWVNDRPLVALSDEAAERAFNGHLEHVDAFDSPLEFGTFTARQDAARPFSLSDPGNAPDIAAGAIDTWTVQHPDYGLLQAGSFRSQDGRTLFIVLRDTQRRTFVSSIQDAEAGLTPFGTRTDAYRAGALVATPIAHRGQTVGTGQTIPGRPPQYDYVNDLGYRNDLNALFEGVSLEARTTPTPTISFTSAAPGPAGLTAAQRTAILDRVPEGLRSTFAADDLVEIDEFVRAARADGVSATRIDAVLAVPRPPVRAEFAARIDKALTIERANARGLTVFVSKADAGPGGVFELFADGSQANSVRVENFGPYFEIGAKAAFERAGKPQVWTADEARIVREQLLPARSELRSWYFFEAYADGQGIAPIFLDDQIGTLLDDLFGPNATRTPQVSAPSPPPLGPGVGTAPAGSASGPARGGDTLAASPSAVRIASPGLYNALETRAPPGGPGATQPPPGVSPVRTPVRAGDTQAGNLGRPLVDDPNATRPPPDSPATSPRPGDAGPVTTSVRAGDTQAGNLGRPLVDDPNATLPPPGVSPVTPATPGGGPPGTPVRAGDTQAGNLGRPLATPPVDDPNATLPPPDSSGVGPTGTRLDPGQTRIDPSQTRIDPSRTRVDPGQTRIDPGQTRLMPRDQVFRLSDLENPFNLSARAVFDERTLLAGAAERARINGALLREDGEAIAKLASGDVTSYLRRAERRGFIADRSGFPRDAGDSGEGRLIPLIDRTIRGELEGYLRAYAQGQVANGPGVVGVPSSPRRAAAPDPTVSIVFTSLGRSSGDAFRMTVINRGADPIELRRGESFVIRPVMGVSSQAIDKEVAALSGAGVATSTIEAYCLEYARQPPPAGLVFELAPAALQNRTAPVTRIFEASAALRDQGRLPPVAGDPSSQDDYFEAVRQWAIWTREQGFDQATYTKAFIDHSRRNVESAGLAWTAAAESAFRALAPGRWEHVQAVLRTVEVSR